MKKGEGTITNPRTAPFNASSYYCKWNLQQPETSDSGNKYAMTLAATVSGLINKGNAKTNCRQLAANIMIRGELLFKI